MFAQVSVILEGAPTLTLLPAYLVVPWLVAGGSTADAQADFAPRLVRVGEFAY